ncbi:hypothetical protein ACLB2K_004611 [Fragaria x ananassa]
MARKLKTCRANTNGGWCFRTPAKRYIDAYSLPHPPTPPPASPPPDCSPPASPPLRHDLFGANSFPGEWRAGEPWRPMVPPEDNSNETLVAYKNSLETNIRDWAKNLQTKAGEMNNSLL